MVAVVVFFFNATATTEIYTLSLHDALPIFIAGEISTSTYVHIPDIVRGTITSIGYTDANFGFDAQTCAILTRSEEHTSELQSLTNLVCRLLLEKKKSSDMQLQLSSDLSTMK